VSDRINRNIGVVPQKTPATGNEQERKEPFISKENNAEGGEWQAESHTPANVAPRLVA